MNRLAVSIYIALAVFLLTSATGTYATEIARYDDGPFAGMGYPYSESARAGNLLFLAGHKWALVCCSHEQQAQRFFAQYPCQYLAAGMRCSSIAKLTFSQNG